MTSVSQIKILTTSANTTREQAIKFGRSLRDLQPENSGSEPFYFNFKDAERFNLFSLLGEIFPIQQRLVAVSPNLMGIEYTVYSKASAEPDTSIPAKDAKPICHFWIADDRVMFDTPDNQDRTISIDAPNLLLELGCYIAGALIEKHFKTSDLSTTER